MRYDCKLCKNEEFCKEASENGEFVKCKYEATEIKLTDKENEVLEELLTTMAGDKRADDKRNEIEYIVNLNLQYIDKIAKTKDVSKKKAIRYIKEHLIASTRSLVKRGGIE